MCESPREETGVRPGAHQARPKCGDGRGSAPRWVSIAPSRGSRAPSPPPPGADTWPARAGSSAEPSRGRRFFPSDSKTRDVRGRAPGRPSSLRFAAVTGGKRLPPESQGHRPRTQTLSRSRANPGARSSPDFRLRRENEARGGSGRRHPDLRHRRLAPRGAGRGPWRRLSGSRPAVALPPTGWDLRGALSAISLSAGWGHSGPPRGVSGTEDRARSRTQCTPGARTVCIVPLLPVIAGRAAAEHEARRGHSAVPGRGARRSPGGGVGGVGARPPQPSPGSEVRRALPL